MTTTEFLIELIQRLGITAEVTRAAMVGLAAHNAELEWQHIVSVRLRDGRRLTVARKGEEVEAYLLGDHGWSYNYVPIDEALSLIEEADRDPLRTMASPF